MTNLIFNPSFTQFTVSSNVYTFTSWTSTNANLSPNTQEYLFNATSLQVSATSTSASVTSNAVANVAGSGTYTASVYVRVPAGGAETTFVLSLETYDSGDTLDQTFTASSQKISPSSGWVRLGLTATFDGTASSAKIKVDASDTAPGRVFLLDGAQLVSGYSAVEFDFIEPLDQGQERAIINRALSKVPFPHLTGVELNADIQLGEFIFNTVDASGVAYVITGIDGLLAPPEPEYEEVSRGFYADGDYDIRGRYTARFITLTGSILPPDKTYVTNARQKLIRAMDLVYRGAWLKLKPANEPEKALFVRLAGSPSIDVVNPRGRIEFSIGLKAADPLLYEWNDEREDGYTVVRTDGANYTGEHLGEVTANNSGNYKTSGVFEIRGPITGDFATLFNYSNANLIRIIEKLRGEKYYLITRRRMANSVARLKFSSNHDLKVGDSIVVNLPETVVLTNVSRGDGNSVALIETVGGGVFGLANGDSVQISGLPVTNNANTLNGVWVARNANTSANTFTVATGANTAIAITNAGGATAFNITNSRFNGVQVISSVRDGLGVDYPTKFSEFYQQRAITGANVVLGRSIAFRDADYLEIDTKEREVALNGDATLQRSKLDVLSDWIQLEPGKNVILLDDSVQTTQKVVGKSYSGDGLANLVFAENHSFRVGDNIVVSGLGATYDTRGRAKISSYSRDGNVVTAVSTAHGYSNNDSVLVRGLDATIDGQYSATNVNANAFTFVTNSSGTIFATNVDGLSKKVVVIANYFRTNSLVTISTTSAHGINANTAVYVSGVGDEFDGQWFASSVTSGATNTLTYNTSIRFTEDYPLTDAPFGARVSQRFPVVSATEKTISYLNGFTALGGTEFFTSFGLTVSANNSLPQIVNSVSRLQNVATISTITNHGFSAGQFLTVDGFAQDEFQVFPGDAIKINTWTSTNNGTVLRIQTASTHNIVANDVIVIYNVETGSFLNIDGQYTVTSANVSNRFINVNASSPIVTSYAVLAKELTDGIARLTLNVSPEMNLTYTSSIDGSQLPTQINVSSVDSTFNGTFDVLGVNTETNTITYTLPEDNVSPTAVSPNGSVSLVFNSVPLNGRVYRRARIVYFTINNTAGSNNEATDALSTTAPAGNTVFMKTLNPHNMNTGDWVAIDGLDSRVDGYRQITNVSTTVFRTTLTSPALVRPTAANISRTRNNANATVTTSGGHNLVTGRLIWLVPNTNASTVQTRSYQVLSVVNSKSFIINTGITSNTNLSVTDNKYLPFQSGATAVEQYAILSDPAPTDFAFSYRNVPANVSNATVATTLLANPAGEVALSSEPSLKVYYRSAWIA